MSELQAWCLIGVLGGLTLVLFLGFLDLSQKLETLTLALRPHHEEEAREYSRHMRDLRKSGPLDDEIRDALDE